MPKSSTERYIARLHDVNLSEPILWPVTRIADASAVLERAGMWTESPDGGGAMLLSDSASIDLFLDFPPYHQEDDLALRIEGAAPSHTLTIRPSGAVRVERH